MRAAPLLRDDAPVRTGADADVFAVAPVDEIVPAFAAGPRVVGDLVGGKAGPVHRLLGDVPEDRGSRRTLGTLSLPALRSRSNIVSGSIVSW